MIEELRKDVLMLPAEEPPGWASELPGALDDEWWRVLWVEQPIGWFSAGDGWGFSLWDERAVPTSEAIEADNLAAAKVGALEAMAGRLAESLDSALTVERR